MWESEGSVPSPKLFLLSANVQQDYGLVAEH